MKNETEDKPLEDYVLVSSSNISAVRYVADESTLFVVFSSGAQYAYGSVPQSVYDGLIGAESVGRYFHSCIRNVYPARRIEEEE